METGSTEVAGFEAALAVVLREASALQRNRPKPAERVELLDAAGRVLAEPIVADRDQPPFDRVTRDGFAVRAAEFSAGRTLRVVGQVRAGEFWREQALATGEAIEIMTGAPLPAGADSVAMIEHVEISEEEVRALPGRTLAAGDNFVPCGLEAHAGTSVVAAGTTMGAAEIALAASCGQSEVAVWPRPKVAIIATGDELVRLQDTPANWQIRNSNSYGLAALVTAAGGLPGRLPIARDLRAEVWERIAQGRMWDLLLLSGGVSMGKYDLVEEVLAEFGAEFFFTGVAMQPGKPVVFGRLPRCEHGSGAGPECLFFGLPGNPVSTQVTFHCFVEPLLRALAGGEIAGPRFVQATLSENAAIKPGMTRVLPARLTSGVGASAVKLIGWQGSGDMAANARANCYAVLGPERTQYTAGDVITVLLR